MNKIYRLIWNEITRSWVAVSEIAKARGKRASGMVAGYAGGSAGAGRFALKPLVLALAGIGFAHAAPPVPTQLSSLSQHRRLKDPKVRLFTDYMALIIRDATRRAVEGLSVPGL